MMRTSSTGNTTQATNPYSILGLDPTATLQEVKQAYKKLALRFHPDKNADKSPDEIETIADQFKAVKAAYDEIISGLEQTDELYLDYAYQLDNQDIISDNILNSDVDIDFDITSIKNLNSINANDGFITLNKKEYDCLDPDSINALSDEKIKERLACADSKYQAIGHEINDKAFLWKAEKANCAPIYVFGSIHATTMDKDDIFGDAIDNVIDKVDIVFTEVDVIDKFSALNGLLGIESNLFEHDTSLDHFIAQRAYDRGKLCRPLENKTVREACELNMNNMESDVELQAIPTKELEQFTRNFLTHVTASDWELHEANESTAKRNMFWMATLLSNSSEKQQAAFVVCGAGHNTGTYGLPNLLASESYKLTPLMKTAPTPKSHLIREAARTKLTLFIPEQTTSAQKVENKAIIPYKPT